MFARPARPSRGRWALLVMLCQITATPSHGSANEVLLSLCSVCLCCFPLLFRAFFTLLSSKICRNDQRWLCCFGKPVAQNCRQECMYMSGLHARVHA